MAQNFIECDREQAFLLPPSLREWAPEDHLVWFVFAAPDGTGFARQPPSLASVSCAIADALARRGSAVS